MNHFNMSSHVIFCERRIFAMGTGIWFGTSMHQNVSFHISRILWNFRAKWTCELIWAKSNRFGILQWKKVKKRDFISVCLHFILLLFSQITWVSGSILEIWNNPFWHILVPNHIPIPIITILPSQKITQLRHIKMIHMNANIIEKYIYYPRCCFLTCRTRLSFRLNLVLQ